MADAAARYQTLDGQGNVAWNLVYNPTSGNWELEQQAVIEAVTGNLYLAVDGIEDLIQDQLQGYHFSGYIVDGTAVYVGYEEKAGVYYVQYIETSTGVVTYAVGTGGIVAPGSYSGLSYGSFASKF